MMVDPLDAFRALLAPACQAVLAGLPPYDPRTALREAERLRRAGVADEVANAALTQSRLRARARAKFGALADRMYFTEDGLQQATRPAVADHRAARYAALGPSLALDLCCGIGGDLAALAGAAGRVTALDRDPLTAAVAEANAAALGIADRVDVRVTDVEKLSDAELRAAGAVFIDPARRTSRGRVFDPEAMSPPLSAVVRLAAVQPALGAKLAPGVPHRALPGATEAEWVSYGGDLLECALWFGPLAGPVRRRATVLPSGATLTGSGEDRAPVGAVGSFLHEPDGAVIRAGLVAEAAATIDGRLVDPSIAYVTTDRPAASPFLRSYTVHDVLPFSVKRLRAALRERGVGRLTVKKRGFAMEPEELIRQLRLTGDAEATVVLTRIGDSPVALLVTPLH